MCSSWQFLIHDKNIIFTLKEQIRCLFSYYIWLCTMCFRYYPYTHSHLQGSFPDQFPVCLLTASHLLLSVQNLVMWFKTFIVALGFCDLPLPDEIVSFPGVRVLPFNV